MGPTLQFSEAIHQEKYRSKGESFKEAMNRLAGALADNPDHFKAFRETLLDMRFMPGGRIQGAIGSTKSNAVTAHSCFVSGRIEDSFVAGHGSIMEIAKEAATTMRMGGGIGYDFSTLRPRGATVNKLQSISSGPVSFMGIYDAICCCIASSGHRRGAQMGVMRVDHPDIEEFVHAKQPPKAAEPIMDALIKVEPGTVAWQQWYTALQAVYQLTGFNISVAVTDEFMKAVDENKSFTLRFSGRAYREIDAGALWEMIMRSAWDWAEPGIIFIDTVNRMNNLNYCEEIIATNPCVPGDTLVSTDKGLIEVKDMEVGDIIKTAIGAGKVKSIEEHNNVSVFKVCLSDGSEVKATAAHIFHKAVGKYFDSNTVLDKLRVGDKLRLAPALMPNNTVPFNPFKNDRVYGLIVGVTIGDGCYTIRSAELKIACNVNEQSWINVLKEAIPKSSINKSTESCTVVRSTAACKSLDRTPLKRGYSHQKVLPLELLNTNRDFLAGYIDGMICTDGNVHMSKSNPMIRVHSCNKESLMMLKRALSCFGILARVYPEKGKPAGSQNLVEEHIVTRRHQGHVLCILGSGVLAIYKDIGLSHPDKQARLEKLVNNFSLTGSTWTATIKSIELCGKEKVYDLFEPKSDTWVTNGVYSRGCGEQPLPAYGACLLGSFNLTRYVRAGANWFFDWELFKNDIPHVVRAMDNVVDLASYPLYEQEKAAKATRRMGLGVTGLANAIEACGHSYGSKSFVFRAEHILKTLAQGAYRASALLAQEKGAFPRFDAKYQDALFIQALDETTRMMINDFGIRNSHLTSIAPTGTISLCADNVSSGIEPVFAYSQKRLVRMEGGEVETILDDYGVRVFDVKGKRANEVTIDEHLAVLAVASKCVDSAVSKTCNVPSDTPWADFKDLYMRAWKMDCKGLATYQVGGKRAGIIISKDVEQSSCRIDLETGRRECE